ncbi:MAG: hypothetical protein ABR507_09275 [Actinomycetota bacterium]|nr:hypothetical protein [Actinomycetota bacterium]
MSIVRGPPLRTTLSERGRRPVRRRLRVADCGSLAAVASSGMSGSAGAGFSSESFGVSLVAGLGLGRDLFRFERDLVVVFRACGEDSSVGSDGFAAVSFAGSDVIDALGAAPDSGSCPLAVCDCVSAGGRGGLGPDGLRLLLRERGALASLSFFSCSLSIPLLCEPAHVDVHQKSNSDVACDQ